MKVYPFLYVHWGSLVTCAQKFLQLKIRRWRRKTINR